MSDALTKKGLARLVREVDEGKHNVPNFSCFGALANALDPPKPKFERGDWWCSGMGTAPRPCLDNRYYLSSDGNKFEIPAGARKASPKEILAFAERCPEYAGKLLWHMSRIIAREEPK